MTMTAWMLTYGKKEDYIGCSKLVGMKIPDAAAYVAFANQEVGEYFLQNTNLTENDFDMVDANTAFFGINQDDLTKLHVVLYRNETDVDVFINTRERFPFPEFLLSVSEIVG